MTNEYERDQETAEQLRETREQVRAESTTSFAGTIRPHQDEHLLYGDRDARLLPQIRQHLAEAEKLWQVQEQPFHSRLPVIGPLIAWFRERWNRISTRWYVQPMLQQQIEFNVAVVRVLQDLHRFMQTSSYDLVRRMDALFYPLDQGQAAAYAWLRDLREIYTALSQEMEEIETLMEEQAEQREGQWEERSQEITNLMEEQAKQLETRLEQRDQHLTTYLEDRLHDSVNLVEERSQDLATLVEERSEEVTSFAKKRIWETATQLEEQLQELAHQQQLHHRGQSFLRMKLDRLMARTSPRRQASSEEPAEAAPSLDQERQDLMDHVYYRFEDLYRPEEEIREAQRFYLPFFRGKTNVLDLGCGKGEFLELLRGEGVEAYGVDLNEQMVQICQEKELRVVQEEALQHLAGLPEASLGGLFAAHLVEHLSPTALVELIQQAWEKLGQEAYLAFETPNPLCVWALVNYFYLDMSHIKPIHPQALSFLLEMHGFRNVEIRYLHPVPEGVRMATIPQAADTPWQEIISLLNTNMERLNDLLYGYTDYAVIAQK